MAQQLLMSSVNNSSPVNYFQQADFESKIIINGVLFLQEAGLLAQFSCKFIKSVLRDSLVLKESFGRFAIRPKERKDSGVGDFSRSRLDQIVDMNHSLAKLSRLIDWKFLEEELDSFYRDVPVRPPLPTRLMAGLAVLLWLPPVK